MIGLPTLNIDRYLNKYVSAVTRVPVAVMGNHRRYRRYSVYIIDTVVKYLT